MKPFEVKTGGKQADHTDPRLGKGQWTVDEDWALQKKKTKIWSDSVSN